MHLEFLLEEESAAEAIRLLLPKIIGKQATHKLHFFQGKQDLLQRLPQRLAGYSKWIPEDYRIVVLLDRDDDDCRKLKRRMDAISRKAGLTTRTVAVAKDRRSFHVLNRIAVEELEAWFFGDVEALCQAYPRVPPTLAMKARFRNSDGIVGGTWEAMEQVLQKAGYYPTGLPKIEAARRISAVMEPNRNRSPSFQCFCSGLRKMVG
jgi:hypothetical protein